MDPWLSWTLIVLMLILTAWYSGAETAIESCNQFKFKVKANEGNKTAKYACKIIEKFNDNVISVLIGYNITSTVMSTISTVVFALYVNAELVNIVSTAVISILCYVFSDTLPKIIARSSPDKYLTFSVYPMIVSYFLFYPLIKFFGFVSWLIKKTFRIKEDITLTQEDFANYVDSIEDKGEIDEEESDIIQNTLDFADTTVKECFTPANKMTMINIDKISNQKLNELLLDSKYSRIPLYVKNKNNIVGILNVKKYFNEYINDKHVNIMSIVNEPYFIEPNTKIDTLFEGFKKNRTHIAIVKQNGKVLGMITMDDVLEELVGEISYTQTSKEENK